MDGGVEAEPRDTSAPAVRSGDDSFDAWVVARSPALLRFAFVLTGNQQSAEDALAGALATAYERWNRVSGMGDRDAYVRRVLVNAHISWWRRFRRREVPVADVRSDPRDAGGHAPDPAHRVSDVDLVRRLCATLPPRQRAAVVLRFYEDLRFAEIAGLLDCSEATVRSYVHRALGSLRTLIEAQDQEDGHA
jgi:RNA polymerase sigma-70 factor (sigma-E family)